MSKKLLGAVILFGLLGGLSAFVWVLTNNKVVIGYNQGYKPDQPINFPHDKHAGKHTIECKYCHTGVEVSRHASVPSLNVCMNCHGPGLVIKEKLSEAAQAEIEKLTDAYNNNKAVAWQKVHLLPDHVKFNHAPHIKKGKDCTVCHGPVQEMEKVSQVSSLSMGWCVNCHRLPENNAPVSCATCHY